MSNDKIVIDAQVRHEIESLVYEHAWMIDNHQSERLADLYTENGKLYGIVPETKGREALTRYGAERANMKDRHARHVCTNLRLLPLDGNRIQGNVIITLFRHKGEGLGTADPVAVADARDIYTRGADGKWRIAERKLVLAFESETHRH